MAAAADLPAPSEPDRSPRDLLRQLGERVGEQRAASWCADLLAGADLREYVAVLPYLGSNCGVAAFDPRWHDYWHRTWGARGLLYVWANSVAPVVVEHLADRHWRPAEMCAKVAARREIGEAGPGAVLLAENDLPRVRAAAIRCLGSVGDTEHVAAVMAALDDESPEVRRAATRALESLSQRLDLPPPPFTTRAELSVSSANSDHPSSEGKPRR